MDHMDGDMHGAQAECPPWGHARSTHWVHAQCPPWGHVRSTPPGAGCYARSTQLGHTCNIHLGRACSAQLGGACVVPNLGMRSTHLGCTYSAQLKGARTAPNLSTRLGSTLVCTLCPQQDSCLCLGMDYHGCIVLSVHSLYEIGSCASKLRTL